VSNPVPPRQKNQTPGGPPDPITRFAPPSLTTEIAKAGNVQLKGKARLDAAAWASFERVQLEIGELRFTASAAEADELARQLVAAVDELNAAPDTQGSPDER
jgi:hypothetical protein